MSNFENDLRAGEDSRVKEMNKPKNSEDSHKKPADGEEVGNPDKDSTKKEGSEEGINQGGENIQEIRRDMIRGQERVKIAIDENPDWPPAKGNPEAETKIAGDLESGLNQVA